MKIQLLCSKSTANRQVTTVFRPFVAPESLKRRQVEPIDTSPMWPISLMETGNGQTNKKSRVEEELQILDEMIALAKAIRPPTNDNDNNTHSAITDPISLEDLFKPNVSIELESPLFSPGTFSV